MVLTAGPTLSVPVRSVLPFRKSSGMSVMAGSASSQHASVPPGAMAHQDLFTPGAEARETLRGRVSSAGAVAMTGGSGSAGVSLT